LFPPYRGVSYGESAVVGMPVPEYRYSRAIAPQHGTHRRSTGASDLDGRIRRSGRAGLFASSSHHKSAIYPRRTPHTLNGASAWRLHRPEFNHAFSTEQRSQRSTENSCKGNGCVDLAESKYGEFEPKARPVCAQQTNFPQKYRKTTQRHYGLDTCGGQMCSAKIKKTPQKSRSSHPNGFSLELMTRSMIPQKSKKTGLSGSP
jgi:hypothetical protein